MKKTIIDIETEPRPLADIIHLMPKFEAASNIKDPAKIAAAIEEKKAAWLEKLALSPLTGRICAIGYCRNFTPEIHVALDDDTEHAMLIEFWSEFDAAGELSQFIGHNLHGFDLPFIVRRSWAHGITVPITLCFSGRGYANDRRFVDTMKAFTCGTDDRFVTLDTVAKFFGFHGKTEDIGADFGRVLRSEPDRALAYLRSDLETTSQIAARMGLL